MEDQKISHCDLYVYSFTLYDFIRHTNADYIRLTIQLMNMTEELIEPYHVDFDVKKDNE